MARSFDEITEREILALGIALEEEDQRIYADFADGLGRNVSGDGQDFAEMAARRAG